MELVSDLFLIRIILALSMLTVGGIYDLWKREVHDYLWIIFGVSGGILLIFEPLQMEVIYSTLFALIITPISIIIWRMGLFGGADAFALIVLAVIAPQLTISENSVTPFTTLSNAAILFVIPLLINAFRNLVSTIKGDSIFDGFEEPMLKKIIISFLGHRAKNPKHGFLIEKTENGVKRISLSFHHAENEEFTKSKDVWITPGISYLLLILGGFLIQLVFGDLILTFFRIF